MKKRIQDIEFFEDYIKMKKSKDKIMKQCGHMGFDMDIRRPNVIFDSDRVLGFTDFIEAKFKKKNNEDAIVDIDNGLKMVIDDDNVVIVSLKKGQKHDISDINEEHDETVVDMIKSGKLNTPEINEKQSIVKQIVDQIKILINNYYETGNLQDFIDFVETNMFIINNEIFKHPGQMLKYLDSTDEYKKIHKILQIFRKSESNKKINRTIQLNSFAFNTNEFFTNVTDTPIALISDLVLDKVSEIKHQYSIKIKDTETLKKNSIDSLTLDKERIEKISKLCDIVINKYNESINAIDALLQIYKLKNPVQFSNEETELTNLLRCLGNIINNEKEILNKISDISTSLTFYTNEEMYNNIINQLEDHSIVTKTDTEFVKTLLNEEVNDIKSD